jgi:iron complex transport system ATP-binding protein
VNNLAGGTGNAAARDESLLATQGLVVGHDDRSLFPPLDFTLKPGEFVCLLGGNGAGKTTLLKTLAGILPPLSGSVSLGGDPVSALAGRERARRAALLLTDAGLPPFLLGRELVSLGRTPHASWLASVRAADEAVAQRVMETLRCAHLADRRLGQLSDGERQRLCLARALAQDAPVLLLDEPLSHLDLPAKAELLSLLRDWARAGDAEGSGRAVLAAVHEVDLALGFADRCLMLAPGEQPFIGLPEEAAGEPLRRFFPGWPGFWDPLGLRRNRQGSH